MDTPPALGPSRGQENKGLLPRDVLAISLCVVFWVLATSATCARLWTQRVLLNKLCPEDALIAIATVMSWGMLAGCLVAIFIFHFDEHGYQLSPQQRVQAEEFVLFGEFGYVVIGYIIKIAILLFYLRLAARVTRRLWRLFTYSVYTLIVTISIHRVAYIVIVLTTCKPFAARWLQKDEVWVLHHKFKCRNEGSNLFVASALSSVEDLIIALLPALIFCNLRMPWWRKIGIWSLFATSISTCVISSIRTYFFWAAYFAGEQGWVWNMYWAWILTVTETIIGLICASVPALQRFFSHHSSRARKHPFFLLLRHVVDLIGSCFYATTLGQLLKPKRPPSSDNLSSHTAVFDGTMSSISRAQITWTPQAPASLDRRHTKTLPTMRSRSSEDDEESDLRKSNMLEMDSMDADMAIYVRSSFCVMEEYENSSEV